MNNIPEVYIGVDVSKNYLDIYFHPLQKLIKFPNNSCGFDLFLEQLTKYDVKQIVCEASGGYENLMLETLAQKGYKTWRIDPRRIKGFIISEGIKAKTDSIDAKMISLFAAQKKNNYQPAKLTKSSVHLRELVRRKTDLGQIIVTEKLRLHHPKQQYCKKLIEKHILFMEKQVNKIEQEINTMVDTNKEWKYKTEILKTMPAIGEKTANILISDLPELGKLNSKEIASLVGLAPFTKQSGNYKGIAKIKDGRMIPRRAIYMAALSAIQTNNVFKPFYERLLKKGKKPKVALVAVMRKMIVILNAMVKNRQAWSSQKFQIF